MNRMTTFNPENHIKGMYRMSEELGLKSWSAQLTLKQNCKMRTHQFEKHIVDKIIGFKNSVTGYLQDISQNLSFYAKECKAKS